MRFLVCLDRTAFARSILPVAKSLAAAAGAEVELLTVVTEARDAGEEPWSGQRRPPHDEALAGARNALAQAAAEFEPPASVTVSSGSSPAQEIIKYVRTTRPDLIALATHSRGAHVEAALGSTAREVVRAGVAPVLLLHPVSAAGMHASNIPRGISAFTADGEPLGTVTAVAADRIEIAQPGGGSLSLPAWVAGAITTGCLVLEVALADVERLSIE